MASKSFKYKSYFAPIFLWMCIGVSAQQIQRIEYFIDDDPGQGNGVPIDPLDGVLDSKLEEFRIDGLDVSGLSLGWHILNIRSQDTFSNWGGHFPN